MSARQVEELPKVEGPDETERLAEGFDDGTAWKKVSFRGVVYKLVELPIGKHNDIETKSTVKRVRNGEDVEEIDTSLQNRLMLVESMVEPRKGEPGFKPVMEMGTRVYLNLVRVMQELHYFAEKDELRSPKPDEDKAKGNG